MRKKPSYYLKCLTSRWDPISCSLMLFVTISAKLLWYIWTDLLGRCSVHGSPGCNTQHQENYLRGRHWDGGPDCESSINQSINQSIDRPTDRRTNGPTDQPTNQPTNQLINQSINQSFNYLIGWPSEETTNWLIDQPTITSHLQN